jgi:hypothetical protein
MTQRRELFKNDSQSNLNGTVLSGDSTITVVDGSAFPVVGFFRVLVDDELMLCTGVSGNTLSVARGLEGTTAAGHSSGATVYQVLTQGGLQRYLRDNDPLVDSDRPAFRIIDANENRLAATDFTMHDYGSGASAAMHGKSIIISPGNATAFMTRPVPAGPTWKLTAAVRGVTTTNTAYWGGACIGVMDTGNKTVNYRWLANRKMLHVCKNDGNSGYVSPDIISQVPAACAEWMWLRLTDPNDGNWHFQFSDDGKRFLELGTYGKTSYLGTVDRIFFGMIDAQNAGCWSTLAAWDDGAGILGA